MILKFDLTYFFLFILYYLMKRYLDIELTKFHKYILNLIPSLNIEQKVMVG